MRTSPRCATGALLLWIGWIGLCGPLAAQNGKSSPDRVTLENGDTLNGTVKSMADGKLVFAQPSLADLSIPIANVTDLQTTGPVKLKTDTGEVIERRITGIRDRQLVLAEGPALPLEHLAAINPPPVKWSGSLSVGAAYLTGNTERRMVNSDFNAERRTDGDRTTAGGYWNYSEDKDQATKDWRLSERKAGANLKYDYFLSKRSYLFATTSVETDTLADIQLRFTAGAGYGYQFVERPDFKLGAELGASYVSEDYRSSTPTSEYVAVRAAYKLEKKITDRLTFKQVVEVYPSLEESEDVFVKSDSRLIANLTDSMIAQLKVTYDWDNTPATGRERSDLGAFLSVGWTF